MQHLYFIRHGESEYNAQSQFAGSTDTPLTKKGHQQAADAGKLVQAKQLSFDVIVSSPSARAHHTAQHIASAINYPHDDIIVNELFMERDYGMHEGMKAASLTAVKYYLDESTIDDHDQVETLIALQERANAALEFLHALNHDTVLVVAHGAFGRALYRAVNNLPITKRDVRFNNAEVTKFI